MAYISERTAKEVIASDHDIPHPPVGIPPSIPHAPKPIIAMGFIHWFLSQRRRLLCLLEKLLKGIFRQLRCLFWKHGVVVS